MGRGDDTQRWKKSRKQISFLYRRLGLTETRRLMDSWNFKASKREYVYRLGGWGIRKNRPPKDTARWPRSQFSDLDELYLCLWAPQAFDSYRKQVETMGDGEQVLCLLLCCARAIETREQGRELAEHIERRLGKPNSGDNDEVCSFLYILHGYVLHRAGQAPPHFPPEVQETVQERVHFLMDNCCAAEAKPPPQKPYVIDIPKLMLLYYGMTVCEISPELRGKKLLGFLVSRLPDTEVACELRLKKHLEWCREKLSSPAARDFSLDILEIPCHGVDSGSLKKAIAYVFNFFLSQYANEPDAIEVVSKSANEGLQLSVCDLFHTLSALILVGIYPVPLLELDRLCRSPVDLMEAASQRAGRVAENLPTNQHVLMFFIEMYGSLTFPTACPLQEKMLMREVCGRSEALIQSLEEQAVTQNEQVESELINHSMFEGEGES